MKACYQGHNEIVELLLAAGANTDLKNQVSLEKRIVLSVHSYRTQY